MSDLIGFSNTISKIEKILIPLNEPSRVAILNALLTLYGDPNVWGALTELTGNEKLQRYHDRGPNES